MRIFGMPWEYTLFLTPLSRPPSLPPRSSEYDGTQGSAALEHAGKCWSVLERAGAHWSPSRGGAGQGRATEEQRRRAWPAGGTAWGTARQQKRGEGAWSDTDQRKRSHYTPKTQIRPHQHLEPAIPGYTRPGPHGPAAGAAVAAYSARYSHAQHRTLHARSPGAARSWTSY